MAEIARWIGELNSPEFSVRWQAGKRLSQARDERAVKALGNVLQTSPHWPLRWQAAEALGRIGGAPALDRLLGSLADPGDPVWQVRLLAAEILARSGDGRAVEWLCRALADRDNRVRMATAEALGRIPSRKALQALRERLKGRGHERDKEVVKTIRASIAAVEKATAHLARLPVAAVNIPSPDHLPRAGSSTPDATALPRVESESPTPRGHAGEVAPEVVAPEVVAPRRHLFSRSRTLNGS